MLATNSEIKFDRLINMSYVPTTQNGVDFIFFRLQQLKFFKLGQACLPVLDIKDKMSSNCTFERPDIEVGGFYSLYPGDLI